MEVNECECCIALTESHTETSAALHQAEDRISYLAAQLAERDKALELAPHAQDCASLRPAKCRCGGIINETGEHCMNCAFYPFREECGKNPCDCWKASALAAIQAMSDAPRGKSMSGNFYLAAFQHGFCQGCILWWGPNNAGYTPDLEQAGIYTAEQIAAEPSYYDTSDTVPVPVEMVESFRVRRTVDVGDTLNRELQMPDKLRAAVQKFGGGR